MIAGYGDPRPTRRKGLGRNKLATGVPGTVAADGVSTHGTFHHGLLSVRLVCDRYRRMGCRRRR